MTAILKFKQSIANQLSKQTPCNTKDLITFMRPAKHLKDGHISLALPKLNASLQDPTPKQELATWTKTIAEKFETSKFIESVSANNTSLHFKFNQVEFTKQVLQEVYKENKRYGWSHIEKPDEKDNTVVIDYSSPNIAKPFHAGHLRSTIIGNFTRIMYDSLGYKVIGINYLGDWGKQYGKIFYNRDYRHSYIKQRFEIGLLAVGFEKYGDKEQLELDPIHHLYQVYVQINAEAKLNKDIDRQANEYFKKMEEGDKKSLEQWKLFRDLSIKSYESIYNRLNIKFDLYSGESQVNSFIPKAFHLLENQDLIQETKDGALIVDMEKYNLDNITIKRGDGTSLYITRDIASLIMRKEKYQFNKGIYVVGSEQSNYFKQLFQLSNLLQLTKDRDLQHIEFGRIKGMSTRNGTVVFLQDILDLAKEKILNYMLNDEGKKKMKDIDIIADQLGISAILIQDMKSKRGKDYEFAWDRMTDSKGDTGVFLQYAHARACGIERKSGVSINHNVDFSILKEKEAIDLIQIISQFPEIVENSFQTLEPCTIVNYLFKLSHATSTASRFLRVKDMNQDISEARMLLFWSARITLRNGLYLLGIKPIKEM